ncbi:MAG: pyridoxal phosphate-dependent aminotransferase [Candidatus Aminicenantia bacterium]
MKISKRGESIQASPIRKLKPYADQAKAKGIHIYHLNIGQPDIPTPQPIINAFHNYQDEVLSYGPSQGFLELRQAIAKYFHHYRINLNEDDIIITIGGSEAIHFSFNVIADVGEEIIIPEPFYTNYNGYAAFADVKIVPATTKAENGFRLPPVEEIESKISSKTRAILICSPNNPTGTIYTRQEIESLIQLAEKYDLFLIGDEVYKEFAYDNLTHTSLLEFPEISERVIVVDSISKRFSCCGARIGTVITRNKEIYQSLLKFAQARLCPPSVEQKAALAAYQMEMDYFNPIREEYQKRRNVLYKALKSIPSIVLEKPQGAFYMIVKLPIKDAEHFTIWLLTDFQIDNKTVMLAPGEGFYATLGKGKDEVRIAYVLKEEDLKKAAYILTQGLEKYKSLYD